MRFLTIYYKIFINEGGDNSIFVIEAVLLTTAR